MINKKLSGLIAAAGAGFRILSHSSKTNKTLLRVGDTPLVDRNIQIMRDQLGITDIYILVGYKKHQLIDYLGDGSSFDVSIKYIEVPDVDKGLATGIIAAEPYLHNNFCLMLGDEFYNQTNHNKLLELLDRNFTAICSVKELKHPHKIKKNYSVTIDAGKISELVEKPDAVYNNLLGCGTYVFTPEIFNYIKNTPPSVKTQRVELTDAINKMVQDKKNVYPFMFEGQYINVNTIDDYNEANYILRSMNFNDKKISLIIPAYNEESSIGSVIDDFQGTVDEIIVADNNSKDKTRTIAESKGATVFTRELKGYGDALKYGMDNSSGDIMILTEADGSFFARDLGKILEYLKDADMVLGTRTTKQMLEQAANMPSLLRLGNLTVAKLIELLWLGKEPRLTDVGCTYRGIWRSTYTDIRDALNGVGPEFSPEMIIAAIMYNKRTIEIPITYSGRVGGESKFSANIFSSSITASRMLKLIFEKRLRSLLL